MFDVIAEVKKVWDVLEYLFMAISSLGHDARQKFKALAQPKNAARVAGAARVVAGCGNATHFVARRDEVYEMLGERVLSVTFSWGADNCMTVRRGDRVYDVGCDSFKRTDLQYSVIDIKNPMFGIGTEMLRVIRMGDGRIQTLKRKHFNWEMYFSSELTRLLINSVACGHVRPATEDCIEDSVIVSKAMRLMTSLQPKHAKHLKSCARCRQAEEWVRAELDRRASWMKSRVAEFKDLASPTKQELAQVLVRVEGEGNYSDLTGQEAEFLMMLLEPDTADVEIASCSFMGKKGKGQYGYTLFPIVGTPAGRCGRLFDRGFMIVSEYHGSPADRLMHALIRNGAVTNICK